MVALIFLYESNKDYASLLVECEARSAVGSTVSNATEDVRHHAYHFLLRIPEGKYPAPLSDFQSLSPRAKEQHIIKMISNGELPTDEMIIFVFHQIKKGESNNVTLGALCSLAVNCGQRSYPDFDLFPHFETAAMTIKGMTFTALEMKFLLTLGCLIITPDNMELVWKIVLSVTKDVDLESMDISHLVDFIRISGVFLSPFLFLFLIVWFLMHSL